MNFTSGHSKPLLPEDRLRELRKNLDDPEYLEVAAESLARELTIELLEQEYGVQFRSY